MNEQTRCQSVPLASRQSVKPTDPNYDAHVLAHIKAKVIVDPVTGCWLWQGFVQPLRRTKKGLLVGGYGSIGYRGRSVAVHRVVWTIAKGAPPKKIDVCHKCDVRHCCYLDHLWPGTRKQNLQDMANKGRGPCGQKAAQTQCLRGHPLTGDNVLYTNNGRRRGCKTCDRERQRTPKVRAQQSAYQRKRRAEKRAARQEQRA